MDKYQAHNQKVLRNELAKKTPRIKEALLMALFSTVTKAVYEWIDNHTGTYEDDTFNLRDSIGVGIYNKGTLVQWFAMPEKKATKNRPFTYKGQKESVNGRNLLNSALSVALHAGDSDYELIVYCTAPYGVLVENGNGKRGTGWWSENFIPHIRNIFESEYKKLKAR